VVNLGSVIIKVYLADGLLLQRLLEVRNKTAIGADSRVMVVKRDAGRVVNEADGAVPGRVSQIGGLDRAMARSGFLVVNHVCACRLLGPSLTPIFIILFRSLAYAA
jgi:hypothetical protein